MKLGVGGVEGRGEHFRCALPGREVGACDELQRDAATTAGMGGDGWKQLGPKDQWEADHKKVADPIAPCSADISRSAATPNSDSCFVIISDWL